VPPQRSNFRPVRYSPSGCLLTDVYGALSRYAEGICFLVTSPPRFQVVTMGHDANKPGEANKPSDQGDKHNTKDNAEKNARKARGEANNELESGSLNDTTKATRLKQHESGKSGITDYKFPAAKGLFGDAVHTPLTKEAEHKRDADFRKKGWGDSNDLQGAKAENPALEQRLQDRAANHHRDIAAQIKDAIKQGSLESKDVSDKTKLADKPHEKLIPKDGDHLNLKQLLNDYKTPFIDAYEQSRHLEDGEPGKSKTLEEVVDRLKACPWADQVFVDFKFKPDNPEYSNQKSTITIDTSDSPQKQIENFAHEAFHATHQFLSKQYDNGKLSQKEFVDTWLNGEVSSMQVEAKVHQELKLSGEEPKFKFVNDGQLGSIKVADFVKEHGEDGLKEFLRSHQPTGRNAEPYGQHYAKAYGDYLKFFDQNKPGVDKLLETWVNSKHKRDQL